MVLVHVSLSTLSSLEVVIVILWERLVGGFGDLGLVASLGLLVDGELRWLEGWCLHEVQRVVTAQFARQPKEWLFEVVVGLGGDVVVLQVLLSVEGDLLRLDLSVLDLDLIPCQHDWNVLTHSRQITVPIWHILVSDTGCHVEHDDGALPLDVVSVSQSSEFLLSGSVPDIEFDWSTVGVEGERVDLHTEGGDVLLFELASQVTLDERSLADTTISDKDELEFWFL
mmetsp:Transcript_15745/g.43500  ORF Transcript_15745/g.43500 Transcript_15745/m.43500 type:complete len:226 (-) Transcript_15745:180-857(-)